MVIFIGVEGRGLVATLVLVFVLYFSCMFPAWWVLIVFSVMGVSFNVPLEEEFPIRLIFQFPGMTCS